MLRIPHCLCNRLTDGCEVVGLTRRQLSTPQKYVFLFLVLISVRGCETIFNFVLHLSPGVTDVSLGDLDLSLFFRFPLLRILSFP
jgi:hypothetical protein